MAINKNPYESWKDLRDNSDYRSTDTQLTSFVRQQLSQDDFLTKRNRVNSGPYRNKRANIAKNSPIIPHVFGSKDMWGWRKWANGLGADFIVYDNSGLIEVNDYIPGISYQPYNIVGGATIISNDLKSTIDFSYGSSSDPLNITSGSNANRINSIPVDSSNLSEVSTNYIMIYDSNQNKFEFKSTGFVLGLADEDGNPENIDFGSY